MFGELFGNEKLKNTLCRDILSDRQSHAYIFEGPVGSGKHTAALLTAAAVLCEQRDKGENLPCGKCPSCRKVLSEECTDVITVGKGSAATLGVDVIRRFIKNSLYFAPTEMRKKIFIVEDADKMTVQAQNAVLIPMEEPPEFAMFILLCTDSMGLLETVRSRAPVIKTEIFSSDMIRKFLCSKEEFKKYAFDEKLLESAVSLSGGTIGKAIKILTGVSDSEMKMFKLCSDFVRIFCLGNTEERLSCVRSFPSERAELLSLLSFMKSALRDILFAKKSGKGEFLFYTSAKDVSELSSKVSVKRICELWDAVLSAEEDICANAGISAVLTLLASK